MDIALWLASGAVLGWFACKHLGLKDAYSRMLSISMGIAGGAVGGKVIAPMLLSATATPANISLVSLLCALLGAAVILGFDILIYRGLGALSRRHR